jgi:hypothetical protein
LPLGRYLLGYVPWWAVLQEGKKEKSQTPLQTVHMVCAARVTTSDLSSAALPRHVIGLPVCNDSTRDPQGRRQSADILSLRRQLRQTSVLLRSIMLFSEQPMHLAVASDSISTFQHVVGTTASWPNAMCERVSFSYHALYYPSGTEYLRHLNRPCSSARHFFAEYFPNTTIMLNLDTDVIFLTPIETLWDHFARFNSSQMIGMGAMEYAESNGFRHFPKPQHEGNDCGINTGISLLHLERWRRFAPRYVQYLKRAHARYGKHFVFPTQDLFNVFLGERPRHYYDLPCEWNVRRTLIDMRLARADKRWKSFRGGPQHPLCQAADSESADGGALALHGAGGHLTDGTPGFSQVFSAIEAHDLNLPLSELKAQVHRSLEGGGANWQSAAHKVLFRRIARRILP